jgi:hypothetical protein
MANNGYADTISLPVEDDTHIRAGAISGDILYELSSQQLIVGGVGSGQTGRALLRFDLTPLSIQGNINVTNVQLVGQNEANGSATGNYNAYEYEFASTLSQATWDDPDGDGSSGTGDTTPGGTYSNLVASVSNHSSSANVIASFSSQASFETLLETAMQGNNIVYLLVKRTSEPNSNAFNRFRDHTYASGVFTLNIDYEILPPAGTVIIIK